MILYESVYEREGNDAWLKDYVQLHSNDMGLYLEHKKRWNGWNGEIKENNTIELDEYDLEKSQKLLDEYLYEHSIEDGIIIKLNELIN
jgi:hypothetical protein